MQIGVTMAQTVIDLSMLESCVRTVLNSSAPRAMAVLEPLKVTIENYPHDARVELSVPNFPSDESKGSHVIYFDKVVYIDAIDFNEVSALSFLSFSFSFDIVYTCLFNANGTHTETDRQVVQTTQPDATSWSALLRLSDLCERSGARRGHERHRRANRHMHQDK